MCSSVGTFAARSAVNAGNAAHGVFTGVTVRHCTNILTYNANTPNGFLFNGCYFYGDTGIGSFIINGFAASVSAFDQIKGISYFAITASHRPLAGSYDWASIVISC